MLKNQLDKAIKQAATQLRQDAGKPRLVGTGRLRKSIDYRWKTRFPTRDEWQRAHADSTILPLIYTGPNGERIIR